MRINLRSKENPVKLKERLLAMLQRNEVIRTR